MILGYGLILCPTPTLHTNVIYLILKPSIWGVGDQWMMGSVFAPEVCHLWSPEPP